MKLILKSFLDGLGADCSFLGLLGKFDQVRSLFPYLNKLDNTHIHNFLTNLLHSFASWRRERPISQISSAHFLLSRF